eukprot:8109307-Karenia_brevis.AAC.1
MDMIEGPSDKHYRRPILFTSSKILLRTSSRVIPVNIVEDPSYEQHCGSLFYTDLRTLLMSTIGGPCYEHCCCNSSCVTLSLAVV